MACPEFEDRLLGYESLGSDERRAVDAHIAACESCQAFLLALQFADAELERALSPVAAPPRIGREVLAAVRLPSRWPEFLDMTAWAALLAICAVLLLRVAPLPPLTWWWIAPAAVFFSVTAWVSLRLVSTGD